MKQSSREIDLNYRALDLYNIVLDIEKYPHYIPWCTNIEILSKNKNNISANMIVNYKLFPTQTFTSNVIFDLEKLFIKTNYIEGPLKDLSTTWKFMKLKKKKSKVVFKVEFEFSNIIHQKLAELFFPLIETKMMNSFIERADDILN